MRWQRLSSGIWRWFQPAPPPITAPVQRRRGPLIHVVILDGTMSPIDPGIETNAGRAARLLHGVGAPVSLYYEPGIQWCNWRSARDVAMGRGINRQIRRAYGWLASRYRPGDRIFLMGYSRGAYAVRSLAGVIDTVGLLRADCATERNVQTAYRHYQAAPGSPIARDFARAHCHDRVEIEMVGVWDTVKALGLRLPILWQWSEPAHAFHNHRLGPSVKRGFHALALNETRAVFTPVLWECEGEGPHKVEQAWFPGTHGDVGGMLGGFEDARPLANIALVWMLERAGDCGLPLPPGWRARFPTDAAAPSVSTWQGVGKLFLIRARRRVGQDMSEYLHPSVQDRAAARRRLRLGPARPSA